MSPAHLAPWIEPFRPLGDALIESGFRNLWPLFVLPAIAALVSDRTARALPRSPEASIPAAVLTAAPGFVALAALWPVLTTWGHVRTWNGIVLFWLTPPIAGALVGYAAWRAIAREREISALFRASRPPCERLARVAAKLGLTARELASEERDCFVAGVFRPTVFVSAGALANLDDAELEAALQHERAHVMSRDTISLTLLSVMRDLAPWGGGEALKAFQAAREASADREAAARAGALNLASALVALARPQRPAPAAVLSMARPDTLRWRMQALLEPVSPKPSGWRSQAVGGIGFNAALTTWPAVQVALCILFCRG